MILYSLVTDAVKKGLSSTDFGYLQIYVFGRMKRLEMKEVCFLYASSILYYLKTVSKP